MKISNIELTDIELPGGIDAPAITFTIETSVGVDSFLEWINKDGTVEKTDSHLKTNELDKLHALGLRISDTKEIFDMLDEELDKIRA